MKKKILKKPENPYIGKPFIPMYTFYQVALLPILLNQIGIFLLPTEDWIIALALIAVGLLIFSSSDEFKILKFDAKFREKCLITHAVTYVLTFIIGFLGLFPFLVFLIFYDLYWAYAIFKNYQRVYKLT